MTWRRFVFALWVGLLASPRASAADTWAVGAAVAKVRIHCSPPAIVELRGKPRDWVSCSIAADGRPPVMARMRVKGSVGSFRPIDESPSLTLEGQGGGEVFRGVRRLHLDNAVQDPGHLDAAFGAAAFRRMGIESPRVQWAIVELNGRDLGWYVLKEGFTAQFAVRAGDMAGAVLAEPLAGGDLGGSFDLKSGSGEGERQQARDLWARLGDLSRWEDPEARWQGIERMLGIRELLDFAATEVVLAHRDGYALARNNYRLIFSRDRFRWVPWGMDQLLVSDTFTVQPEFSGEALRALRGAKGLEPAWREAVARAASVILDPDWSETWLRETRDRVAPELRSRERSQLEEGLVDLRRRLAGRRQFLSQVLSQWGEPSPAWTQGVLKLSGWKAVDVPPEGRAESVTHLPGLGGPALGLVAGPVTSSSWRSSVRLDPGEYRFSGRVRTSGVLPLPFGTRQGVALRLLGEGVQSQELVGDNHWRELSVDFCVADQGRILSFVCELRGRAGQVWFDRESLQLLRLK